MIQFHKAERRMSKLRLAIAGPAGSGKTYSALLIAFGLGGKVALIDTERGSGELYAHLGEYDVCSITSPFEPEKYTEAVKAAEGAGYGVIIIDSLSHAWSGEGGLLDLHGHLSDRSGNSWAAWRKVTPKHNQLVEAMLQSPCHIIATMRSKMEYTQVTENGKTVVKKLGMNPIQRDGMEYEFTLFMDLDLDHVASASKDRTSLFDGKFFKPSTETGRTLVKWLQEGGIPVNIADATGRPEIHGQQPETPNRGNGGKEGSNGQEVQNGEPASHPDPLVTKGEAGGPEVQPPAGAASSGEASKPETGGNGSRILFAKLGSYGLNRDAYKAYCYGKYNIHSMKQLTAAQREEQIKILNSLKNNDRLAEFKRILSEFTPKVEAMEVPEEDGKGPAPIDPPVDGLRGQVPVYRADGAGRQEFSYF